MRQRPRIYYTESQKALMWERWQKGDSLQQIAQLFDRNHSSVQGILVQTGGIRPAQRHRSRLALTLRIPAKLTDESDDVDRVVSCGAWSSDLSVVGHHRCQFSVVEGGCTTAGQPGSLTSACMEVVGPWVAPLTIFSILFR